MPHLALCALGHGVGQGVLKQVSQTIDNSSMRSWSCYYSEHIFCTHYARHFDCGLMTLHFVTFDRNDIKMHKQVADSLIIVRSSLGVKQI